MTNRPALPERVVREMGEPSPELAVFEQAIRQVLNRAGNAASAHRALDRLVTIALRADAPTPADEREAIARIIAKGLGIGWNDISLANGFASINLSREVLQDIADAIRALRSPSERAGMREALKSFVDSWDTNTCGWNHNSLIHARDKARAALTPSSGSGAGPTK